MTYYLHQPALVTTLTAGQTLGNGGTTPVAAGAVYTFVSSTGGTCTWQPTYWELVGNSGVARFDEAITAAGVASIEDLWDIPSWPTGSANRLYEFRYSSNYICRVEQATNGTIMVLNSTNASVWTSAAVPTGLVRIAITVDVDTTATGTFTINIYSTSPETSTTPTQTWTSSTVNLGSADIVTIRRGRNSSTASSAATLRLLYAQTQDTAALIGPLSVTEAPTVVVTGGDVAYYRYDATGSDLGTSPSLTYSAAHLSGPTGTPIETSDGIFFLPQTTAATTYRITATGADGTDTEDVIVPAPSAGGVATGIIRKRWNGTALVG